MKKLFNMTQGQRFSIRKYSVGVTSVLIGLFLLGIPKGASADELTNTNDVTITKAVESLINENSGTTTEVVSIVQESPAVNKEVAQTAKETEGSSNSSAVSEDSHVNAEATKTNEATNLSNMVTKEQTTKEIAPSAPSVEQSSQEIKIENNKDKPSDVVETPASYTDNQNTDVATVKVDDGANLDDNLAAVEDFLNQNQDNKLSDGVNTRAGRVIGDDYPAAWRNSPNSVDSWGYYTGNCTSFVAHRLHNVNHFEIPRAMGNGAQWGTSASRLGYRVDNTPAVGSVAYYTDGGYGHVAWVADVIGSNILVEEYNRYLNGRMDYSYHTQTQPISSAAGFIHFKDLGGSVPTPTSTSPSTAPTTSGTSLPSSGTYRFTSRKSIKSEPKISSAEIAYYDSGSSVNYDKTLVSDNYEWISYISYSGARRYIAINQIATQPTAPATPTPANTAAPAGHISITNKNDQTGTFDVIVSNVSSPNGVKEVKVPTWSSENGQDDLIWYTAAKQGDGTYKLTVNPSNHKNSLGEYNIHLYYIQNDDKMIGIGTATTMVKAVVRPPIPDQGRYTFSGRASVKAEPKTSSPELAYYDAGNSVNYDKVLLSDGHYWISYIAVSGNRRYISVS
ncbi:SH3 domain-containing protein [Streptococcus sciuri]|uniref:N-acetylmuramoyl-L-alanine amidase n=1 Tax=Streptococcus sciuri TaxID=2973939 RepID=A0ABT2F707_9STRE|nr:SH3 domain-containing protein [Streptococcus sciuri]MCS4488258.1 SH3 domain-containing protein [Streptococcus sciuri]